MVPSGDSPLFHSGRPTDRPYWPYGIRLFIQSILFSCSFKHSTIRRFPLYSIAGAPRVAPTMRLCRVKFIPFVINSGCLQDSQRDALTGRPLRYRIEAMKIISRPPFAGGRPQKNTACGRFVGASTWEARCDILPQPSRV